MNKTTAGIIVVVVIVVGGAALLMNKPNNQLASNIGNNGPKGRVVFSITDGAMNMGNVSEITIQVSNVAVHSVQGLQSDWTTVSTTPHIYNLLTLNANNKTDLLLDTNMQIGTYDQVRLLIDSVTIKMKDGSTKIAKLPSGELKLNTTLVVTADKTSSINFDFLADKSLHMTGNGTYIFAPVIRTKVKSETEINVNENDHGVQITGGHDDEDKTEGMDIDGEIKSNFQIDSKEKLNIDANDRINREND